MATSDGWSFDVRTQLEIPGTYTHKTMSHFGLAQTITGLIRFWANPEVLLAVVSRYPLTELAARPAPTKRELIAMAVETRPRHFALQLTDPSKVLEAMSWVAEHWEVAADLRCSSAEFGFAMSACEEGQFISNTALTMVSLWGALEALFSPSTSELRFRVSAVIAAYLEPPGSQRLAMQQRVAKLYDKRSAAAHGRPSHQGDDLLATYELLRKVLIRIIEQRKVPSREELEARLFGAA